MELPATPGKGWSAGKRQSLPWASGASGQRFQVAVARRAVGGTELCGAQAGRGVGVAGRPQGEGTARRRGRRPRRGAAAAPPGAGLGRGARLAVREVVVDADLERRGGSGGDGVQERAAVRLAAPVAIRGELVGGDADAVAAGLVLPTHGRKGGERGRWRVRAWGEQQGARLRSVPHPGRWDLSKRGQDASSARQRLPALYDACPAACCLLHRDRTVYTRPSAALSQPYTSAVPARVFEIGTSPINAFVTA